MTRNGRLHILRTSVHGLWRTRGRARGSVSTGGYRQGVETDYTLSWHTAVGEGTEVIDRAGGALLFGVRRLPSTACYHPSCLLAQVTAALGSVALGAC